MGTFAYGYKFSKLSFQIEQTTISILIYRNKYPYVVAKYS